MAPSEGDTCRAARYADGHAVFRVATSFNQLSGGANREVGGESLAAACLTL